MNLLEHAMQAKCGNSIDDFILFRFRDVYLLPFSRVPDKPQPSP
jgi:hypothetical protein